MKSKNCFNIIDLFCGVGGFSAGAVAAGNRVVLMVDNWEECLTCARNNFPNAKILNLTLGTEVSKKVLLENMNQFDKNTIHIHVSVPCVQLSQAKRNNSQENINASLEMIRWSLDLIMEYGPKSFSFENVCNLGIVGVLREYCALYPGKIDYQSIDFCEYGVPQNRRRIIAGSTDLLKNMRKMPPMHISVKRAFAKEYEHDILPSLFFKNNSYSRNKVPCRRNIDDFCFTITASRAPSWCDKDGKTVRVMYPCEIAVIQTFRLDWKLPCSQIDSIRAIGNAVPPRIGEMIMLCV